MWRVGLNMKCGQVHWSEVSEAIFLCFRCIFKPTEAGGKGTYTLWYILVNSAMHKHAKVYQKKTKNNIIV